MAHMIEPSVSTDLEAAESNPDRKTLETVCTQASR
jgi:hypothetical protein